MLLNTNPSYIFLKVQFLQNTNFITLKAGQTSYENNATYRMILTKFASCEIFEKTEKLIKNVLLCFLAFALEE